MNQKYWVPALERSNLILNHIANSKNKLKLMDLVELTGINKSSMYSLLHTMKELSWITQDSEGSYNLGPILVSFSAALVGKFNLVESFLVEAEESVKIVEEPIQLGVLIGPEVVYLALKESESGIRLVTDPGSIFPAYASAIGKIQLTKHSDAEIREIYQNSKLPSKTDYTITDVDDLIKKLNEYRKLGYATDSQEAALGFCCAAAPVYNYENDIIAGVSFTMLDIVWDRKKEKAIEEIQHLAIRLSKLAGYKN